MKVNDEEKKTKKSERARQRGLRTISICVYQANESAEIDDIKWRSNEQFEQ